jgi:hypothetical protein
MLHLLTTTGNDGFPPPWIWFSLGRTRSLSSLCAYGPREGVVLLPLTGLGPSMAAVASLFWDGNPISLPSRPQFP